MSGLTRHDAARDAMKKYGFDELVIDESIKTLLEVYGKDGWFFIEDGGYDVLLTKCLEQQKIKENENAEKLRADYAIASAQGTESSHNGWLSSDSEEMDPNEDTNDICEIHDPNEDSDDDWEIHDPIEETDEEEETGVDDSDYDSDDEMIQLTPEPLCQELQDILAESEAQKKGKTL